MQVVLIGSGNVATVLGRLIKRSGHHIVQVVSRDAVHAGSLATELGAMAAVLSEEIFDLADIYIIAVSDQAIPEVSRRLAKGSRLVVHTAGSVSREILKDCSVNYGVLYPLQSLRREIEPSQPVPLLIDGNTADAITLLQDFAQSISPKIAVASDADRLKIHVAAVLVSNFTHHLYALAEDFCAKEKIDFHLLAPLIEETAHRAAGGNTAAMQTGPAARNDRSTIARHLDLLGGYPGLQAIYRLLTESIMQLRV